MLFFDLSRLLDFEMNDLLPSRGMNCHNKDDVPLGRDVDELADRLKMVRLKVPFA